MASAPRHVDVVRIGPGAEDLRIARLEIADPTSELGDLGRADEGEIHRPIEYDPPFAREASVRDLLELASVLEARDSHEPELRELVANGQHVLVSPPAWYPPLRSIHCRPCPRVRDASKTSFR